MRDLGKPLARSFFSGDKVARKRKKQIRRSGRLMRKADETAAKGYKAIDEGRKVKANRIMKKAASLENRSLTIREKKQ